MRPLPLIVASLLSLVGARSVLAKCGPSAPFVMPAPGSVLPPNPVLFVFIPSGLRSIASVPELFVMVDDAGREVVTDVQVLPGSSDQAVVRVAPRAGAGVTLRFVAGSLMGRAAGGWPVKVMSRLQSKLQVEARPDETSSWACSFTSYKVFQSSVAAPAYLVEFATDVAALKRGEAHRVVVEGGPTGINLGHTSCGGWNFDWPSPSVALRFSALLSSGQELRSDQIFVVDRSPDWSELPRR